MDAITRHHYTNIANGMSVENADGSLSTVKNINELRELASQLARANHKQSHFIANALEIMCTQQECIQFYERKFKQ